MVMYISLHVNLYLRGVTCRNHQNLHIRLNNVYYNSGFQYLLQFYSYLAKLYIIVFELFILYVCVIQRFEYLKEKRYINMYYCYCYY